MSPVRFPNQPSEAKVKVLRPFNFEGDVISAGKVVTLPYSFAREMAVASKVEFIDDDDDAPKAAKGGKKAVDLADEK